MTIRAGTIRRLAAPGIPAGLPVNVTTRNQRAEGEGAGGTLFGTHAPLGPAIGPSVLPLAIPLPAGGWDTAARDECAAPGRQCLAPRRQARS